MEILDQKPKPRKPRKRWTKRERICTTRLTTPAVRMVVAEASAVAGSADDAGPLRCETAIHPVISVESRIVETYRRHDDETTPEYFATASRAELIRDGFELADRRVDFGAVIFHAGHGGLVSLCDFNGWGGERSAYRLVACEWSPAEDETRLKQILEELKAAARALVARGQAQ